MTTSDTKLKKYEELVADNNELRWRLKEANSIINAIRDGAVDALLLPGDKGDQVYVLQGADLVYRQIVQEMQEGYITVSLSGTILFSNQNFARIIRQPLEEVTGMTLWELLTLSDQETIRRNLAEGKYRFKLEVNLSTANNIVVPVLLSVAECYLEDTWFICIVVTDLTEQKKSEQRLMRQIFDQAAEAIIVCDERGRILRVNRTGSRFFGMNLLQTLFDQTIPLFHASDGRRFRAEESLGSETATGVEVTYLDPVGKILTFIIEVGRLNGEETSGIKGFLITLSNISERKAAEAAQRSANEQLKASEAQFRSLFDHMINGCAYYKVIFDENGMAYDLCCQHVNPAYAEFLGYPARELTGRRVSEIFPLLNSKERSDWRQTYIEVALSGRSVNFIQYFDHHNKWYSITAYSPEKGAVVVIYSDITENKLAEEEIRRYAKHLAEANSELAATNQELKSFSNIVAHDFRTPMVNLKGFSKELSHSLADLQEILCGQKMPDKINKAVDRLLMKEVPDSLQFINSAVDRLDRMVTALLKLARLGRREMNYQQVAMNDLVNTVVRSFAHQTEQKGIRLEVGLLPHIETDFLAMEQIIGNLLDNAIKYLKPGEPGEISIACTDNGTEYLFSIQDNGRGIAAEDQEKVFEIFGRAGKQDVPGDGMGLACVRTLVRLLGGKVWFESEPGVGTKMSFTIPKR